jgi:hypothetical protein
VTSACESGAGSTETDTSIFTNFKVMRARQKADYPNCFDGGLVVLDANVLLDLYRYSASTTRDFLAALGAVRTISGFHTRRWPNSGGTVKASCETRGPTASR